MLRKEEARGKQAYYTKKCFDMLGFIGIIEVGHGIAMTVLTLQLNSVVVA